MSRTAIAAWQGFVATTLDFARTLLLVDVVDGQIRTKREIRLTNASPQAIAQCLELAGAHAVICGAISAPLWTAVEARGIRIIPFVHGDVEEVIQGCLEGTLTDERFRMAGCRPGRHGPGECRRGRAGPRHGGLRPGPDQKTDRGG
ncbi:MAG: NifB/NifX family molybdenum-iron cluster-binding protein [Spirochaetia bacterium]|jgi:predicted Fe-Mo cluster-binding NifX family protein